MASSRAVIVRGIIPPHEAAALSDGVERAFAAFDDPASDPGWSIPHRSLTVAMTRGWARRVGGVLAVDCPPMLAMLRAVYHRSGLVDVIREFLEAEPVLSSGKTTLRLNTPETPNVGWHQDGAFLGKDARVLNVWLALTDCGVDAPSLDIGLRRQTDVVGAGEDGASYGWSVSNERAEREAGQIVTPIMVPGDAILFDHLCLHRTSAIRATRTRKAVEGWFFAAETLPPEYDSIPL